MKFKYFNLARKLSKKSNHHQHKLGCVIVRKNKIVSIGFNKVQTHTKSPHRFKMLHAEIDAIIGSNPDDLKNSVAYIYRENKAGVPSNARCCDVCYNALALAGIKKICYSVDGTYKEEYI